MRLLRFCFTFHDCSSFIRQLRCFGSPAKLSLRSRRLDYRVCCPQDSSMTAHRVCFPGIDLFLDFGVFNKTLRMRFCRDEVTRFSKRHSTRQSVTSYRGGSLSSFRFRDSRYRCRSRVLIVGWWQLRLESDHSNRGCECCSTHSGQLQDGNHTPLPAIQLPAKLPIPSHT